MEDGVKIISREAKVYTHGKLTFFAEDGYVRILSDRDGSSTRLLPMEARQRGYALFRSTARMQVNEWKHQDEKRALVKASRDLVQAAIDAEAQGPPSGLLDRMDDDAARREYARRITRVVAATGGALPRVHA